MKKKKKKNKDKGALVPSHAEEGAGPGGEGTSEPEPKVDKRTAAERKHDELQDKREKETVAKMASKSHKERIKDMNDYLSKLSEHHDIPRVGPG